MSPSVHSFPQRYAVIAVRQEPRPERSVVAYSDEKALRDLLAAPSIVSLGYHSREEAMANIDRCPPTGQPSARNLATLSADMAHRFPHQSGSARWFSRCGVDLTKHRDFIRGSLRHSFFAVIAFFYSKNLLSLAIRTLISS